MGIQGVEDSSENAQKVVILAKAGIQFFQYTFWIARSSMPSGFPDLIGE